MNITPRTAPNKTITPRGNEMKKRTVNTNNWQVIDVRAPDRTTVLRILITSDPDGSAHVTIDHSDSGRSSYNWGGDAAEIIDAA